MKRAHRTCYHARHDKQLTQVNFQIGSHANRTGFNPVEALH